MNRRLLNAILRTDLYSFVQRVFREIDPGGTFLNNWPVEAICFALTEVAAGRRQRQIVEVPPRSLKSICASVALPAWFLGHDPTRKIICVSYAQPLASQFSAMTRQVMKSHWYRELFPRTRISSDKDTEAYFRTTVGGYRDATSVGGTLTGKGGDLIIIDDPGKPDEMISEAQRSAVIRWYKQTLLGRLNNKAEDAILLVMQRLHVEDLSGHVRSSGRWDILTIPAIAPANAKVQLGPDRWHLRKEGEVLDPVREPLNVLLELKESMGSAAFSAQYQQEPLPADGGPVQWSWFQWCDPGKPLPSGLRIVQSWDCASKAGEFNDYSVCTTWGVSGSDYYLLDILRKRLLFPELRQLVERHGYVWDADEILIEDSAAGTAIIQSMRFDRSPRVPLPIAIAPEKDKVTRLHEVSAIVEQGRVFLPRNAPWLEDFRVELIQFPNGRYDDQVDSFSQFLGRMEKLRTRGATAEQTPMFFRSRTPPRPRPGV